MIHIITKNSYLRQGLIHLLEQNKYMVNIPPKDTSSFGNEFLPGDTVIYHIDKAERLWMQSVLSISYRAKVILFTSSPLHLKMRVVNNVKAIIHEKSSLETILSTIKNGYSCDVISKERHIDLTVREHYILVETLRSTPPNVIARLLDIPVKTVYSHRSNAYRKLGVKNAHEIFLH